jgi:hypothetical protein
MRSGLLFGACSKCCDDDIVCRDECDWPRRIAVTISGIGDGFCWASQNSGVPSDNRFFAASDPPAQDQGGCDEPVGPKILRGGGAFGDPNWFARQFLELNNTWILEFDEELSGDDPCLSPVWSGVVNAGPISRGFLAASGAIKCVPGNDDFVSVKLNRIMSELEIRFVDSAGEGAEAEVTVINALTGGITAVDLIEGGSGYAYFALARVEPVVTAAIESSTGSGASFSVTLAKQADTDPDVWEVVELTLISAGSGYSDLGGFSDQIVFDPDDGETQSPAVADFRLNRQEPTLTIDPQFVSGTGATFEVSLTQTEDSTGQDVWEIDEITVTDPGSGYGDFDFFAIDVGDGVEQISAFLNLAIGRAEPTIDAAVSFSMGGSGAVLSVTLTETTDFSGRPAWEVTAVSVANGGTGYEDFEIVDFSVTSGTQLAAAFASINTSGGVITSVDVFGGGLYYLSTGEVEALTVASNGEFYKTDGSIKSVTLIDGGAFFRLVPTENVIDDTPTVEVRSNTGYDAEITAVVNKDPNSENFGKVTALIIDQAGQNYIAAGELAWQLDWLIGGGCVQIKPLAGASRTPTLLDLTKCFGFDLTAAALPNGARVSLEECGGELLDKEYPAFALIESIVAISEIQEGSAYALADVFGFCSNAVFVDFGEGPITCKIEPA